MTGTEVRGEIDDRVVAVRPRDYSIYPARSRLRAIS